MSRPHSFVPPACARALTLSTSRGDFAAVEALPATAPRATVLLLPGFTGSKEDFNALLEPLAAAGLRAVAVDGRGQYESPPPAAPGGYAQAELARDVLAQADALGAPLHLLGHSFGGQVARAAVLLDARPFRSLTLVSSGPAEISQTERERAKLLVDALAVMTMQQVWEAMADMAPIEETPIDGEDLHRRWLRTDPAQLVTAAGQLMNEPDRVGELAAIRPPLPVHVLSGEEDGIWPLPLLDDMARRLGARRSVVEGAGHSPNTDRPEATAAALLAFWDAQEAPAAA